MTEVPEGFDDIGDRRWLEVYVSWRDGRGGVTECKNMAQALEVARQLEEFGYGNGTHRSGVVVIAEVRRHVFQRVVRACN